MPPNRTPMEETARNSAEKKKKIAGRLNELSRVPLHSLQDTLELEFHQVRDQ